MCQEGRRMDRARRLGQGSGQDTEENWDDWDGEDWMADIDTRISKSKKAKPVIQPRRNRPAGKLAGNDSWPQQQVGEKRRQTKRKNILGVLGNKGMRGRGGSNSNLEKGPTVTATPGNALRAFDEILDGSHKKAQTPRKFATTALIVVATILVIGGIILYMNFMVKGEVLVKRFNSVESTRTKEYGRAVLWLNRWRSLSLAC